MRFSIRFILLLTLVVGLLAAWVGDRHRLSERVVELEKQNRALRAYIVPPRVRIWYGTRAFKAQEPKKLEIGHPVVFDLSQILRSTVDAQLPSK